MALSSPMAVDSSSAFVAIPIESAQWLVILPVIIALLSGALLLMLRHIPRLQAPIAVLACALILGTCGFLLDAVLTKGPITMMMGTWLPPFGIAFTADALGASFAFMASVVAFLVCIYAFYEIDLPERGHGFYSFFLLLLAGVNGCFLTGDIFNLYVWLEVILISSFGLLVFGSRKKQLDGAMKYAFMNLIATTLYLLATAYLYGLTGTLNMADIALKLDKLSPDAPIITVTSLYFLALGMKAAAFPVNFWLPASYHTPRIVVSALFAGLLTKVGIYALLRINVMLLSDARASLASAIAIVAIATMLLGALGALVQTDIRRMAGYLVISGIGSILSGLALASETAIAGAIFYAFHSMIMLTALYLFTAMIVRLSGSFELADLGGLYKRSPVLSILFFIVFMSISGLPPTSGFWPKLALLQASLDFHAWGLVASLLMTSFLTLLVLGRLWAYAFWRDAPDPEVVTGHWDEVRSATMILWGHGLFPLTLLILLGASIGLFPNPLFELSLSAAESILSFQYN